MVKRSVRPYGKWGWGQRTVVLHHRTTGILYTTIRTFPSFPTTLCLPSRRTASTVHPSASHRTTSSPYGHPLSYTVMPIFFHDFHRTKLLNTIQPPESPYGLHTAIFVPLHSVKISRGRGLNHRGNIIVVSEQSILLACDR